MRTVNGTLSFWSLFIFEYPSTLAVIVQICFKILAGACLKSRKSTKLIPLLLFMMMPLRNAKCVPSCCHYGRCVVCLTYDTIPWVAYRQNLIRTGRFFVFV